MNDDCVYMCIDLKSFYASVECVARGLDPFTTNLVVADPDRTEKTICLAITPAMKELGIRNRCRVFEIPAHVDYIMAKPRMKRYMEVSAEIYGVYLRYVSAEDIHVYSIDECFIDATSYCRYYKKTPRELARMLMDAVFLETGICATAGIGTNLFLAKVALDITAKHVEDHIGYLDEQLFREQIWPHRPITDIWQIGPGIARRLAKYGVHDLLGVCFMKEEALYKEFGVNAKHLIDHAHGVEPCTIKDIHEYETESSSMSSGQVLSCDYSYDEALVVLKEMTDALVLELVEQKLVCDSISLMVGYKASRAVLDGEAARGGTRADGEKKSDGEQLQLIYKGEHGKRFKRYPGGHSGGSRKLGEATASRKKLMTAMVELYQETTRTDRPIRRVNIGFGNLMDECYASITLFTDVEAQTQEHDLQKQIVAIRNKFGKNALLKANSLLEKATAQERNEQVGGHHA